MHLEICEPNILFYFLTKFNCLTEAMIKDKANALVGLRLIFINAYLIYCRRGILKNSKEWNNTASSYDNKL